MKELRVTRTIHPIGHGAFYSEVFSIDGDVSYTAVYDCGSRSGKKILEREIERLFKINADTQIDILFVSHFHKDHINGIESLIKKNKIKKIVIPAIVYGLFIVSYLECLEEDDEDTLSFMRRCAKVLLKGEKDSLVEISQKQYCFWEEGLELWKYTTSTAITDDECLEINKIVSELLGDPSISNIDDYFDAIAKSTREDMSLLSKIKSTFEKIDIKHNECSMLVYSSKENSSCLSFDEDFSCLYTGDAVLKNSKFTKDLSYRYIQVPHHGSKSNSLNSKGYLYEAYKKLYLHAFISYGNNYKHPDEKLIEKLKRQEIVYDQIDENNKVKQFTSDYYIKNTQ